MRNGGNKKGRFVDFLWTSKKVSVLAQTKTRDVTMQGDIHTAQNTKLNYNAKSQLFHE